MSVLTERARRRTNILGALEDGEWRAPAIAAWADVSDRQARHDLKWLEDGEFAVHGETDDGQWWQITDKGREYLAGLSDEEKDW